MTIQKWISVKDRLPTPATDGLVCTCDGVVVDGFLNERDEWVFWWGDEMVPIRNVTHWMPYPQPPSGIPDDDTRILSFFKWLLR